MFFYSFTGSTNFGFTNGANSLKKGMDNSGLQPTTTSYDYDSPITEYGAYTEKYHIVKEVIAARNPVKTRIPDAPEEVPLVKYPSLKINGALPLSNLIDDAKTVIESENLLSMEMLPINGDSGQSFGYVVYRKTMPNPQSEQIIKINGYVRDTVMVLVNGKLISPVIRKAEDLNGFGFWRMLESTLTIPKIDDSSHLVIDFVVENFARNNYGSLDQFRQFKGLTNDVVIGLESLTKVQIIPFEFKTSWNKNLTGWRDAGSRKATPQLYRFILNIDGDVRDTYLDMREWTKGITIVNGFVLGRHFFLGPQQSLYLPAPLLNKGENEIIVFEHYDAPETLKFSDKPIFGGPSH